MAYTSSNPVNSVAVVAAAKKATMFAALALLAKGK